VPAIWVEGGTVKFVPITEALALPRCKGGNRCVLSIYALWDPRDGGIRYIGVTNKKLGARLDRHFKSPTNAAMRGWFAELFSAGRGPRIELLEKVPPEEWEDAERGWIHWCRQQGELLNVDRGGMARDSAGRQRPFKAGAYQSPIKIYKDGRKQAVAPGGPGTRTEGRPRLVPVANGVFRRA